MDEMCTLNRFAYRFATWETPSKDATLIPYL